MGREQEKGGGGDRKKGRAQAAAAPQDTNPSKDWPPGLIVMAKMGAYPWWPSRIASQEEVPSHMKQKNGNASRVAVVFLGSNDIGWVASSKIVLLSTSSVRTYSKRYHTQSYKDGMHAALEYLQRKRGATEAYGEGMIVKDARFTMGTEDQQEQNQKQKQRAKKSDQRLSGGYSDDVTVQCNGCKREWHFASLAIAPETYEKWFCDECIKNRLHIKKPRSVLAGVEGPHGSSGKGRKRKSTGDHAQAYKALAIMKNAGIDVEQGQDMPGSTVREKILGSNRRLLKSLKVRQKPSAAQGDASSAIDCFYCKEHFRQGGAGMFGSGKPLVCSVQGCGRAFHEMCLYGRIQSRQPWESNTWVCPTHSCCICEKGEGKATHNTAEDKLWMCVSCPQSFCESHLANGIGNSYTPMRQATIQGQQCRTCQAPSPRLRLAKILEGIWLKLVNSRLALPFLHPYLAGVTDGDADGATTDGATAKGLDMAEILLRIRKGEYQHVEHFRKDVLQIAEQARVIRNEVVQEAAETLTEMCLTALQKRHKDLESNGNSSTASRDESFTWQMHAVCKGVSDDGRFSYPCVGKRSLSAWQAYLEASEPLTRLDGNAIPAVELRTDSWKQGRTLRRKAAVQGAGASVAKAAAADDVGVQPHGATKGQGQSTGSSGNIGSSSSASLEFTLEDIQLAAKALSEMPRVSCAAHTETDSQACALYEVMEQQSALLRDALRNQAIMRSMWECMHESAVEEGAVTGEGVLRLGEAGVVEELKIANQSLRFRVKALEEQLRKRDGTGNGSASPKKD
ncbi:unnamed protein product [Chrysoparadoxa australica]